MTRRGNVEKIILDFAKAVCEGERTMIDEKKKAYREGTKDNTIVVMLIPARTDTRYFHDFIQHRSEIRFVKGRLKFGNSKQAAPFPSMVVIFRGAGM